LCKRGTQFDPAIVKLFAELPREIVMGLWFGKRSGSSSAVPAGAEYEACLSSSADFLACCPRFLVGQEGNAGIDLRATSVAKQLVRQSSPSHPVGIAYHFRLSRYPISTYKINDNWQLQARCSSIPVLTSLTPFQLKVMGRRGISCRLVSTIQVSDKGRF